MASPRLAISKLAQHRISPHSAPKLSITRSPQSVLTPSKYSLKNPYHLKTPCKKELYFCVDTPKRKNIVNSVFSNKKKPLLGCGAFGTVYKALYKGSEVAVKFVKRQNGCDTAVEAERRASTLDHRNIVRVLGVDQGEIWSLVIMDLCGASLQNELEDRSLNKKERIDTWAAIADALRYCHAQGIIHADVKPKNILIGADGQPKLGDFGSSIVIGELGPIGDLRGTPGYIAPEVIRGSRPSIASDIYSLGVLAWQLLARTRPFAEYHPHVILYLTAKGMRPKNPDVNDEFRGEYVKLYKELWAEEAACRPVLNSVIERLNNLMAI